MTEIVDKAFYLFSVTQINNKKLKAIFKVDKDNIKILLKKFINTLYSLKY